jgi:Mg-chelatase subunit ChlD
MSFLRRQSGRIADRLAIPAACAGRWLARRARRFGADRNGHVALIFSLAIVPILALVGAAVDYNRAQVARTRLQAAIDAATLSVAKNANKLSDSELRAAVERALNGNLAGAGDTTIRGVRVTRVGTSIRVEVDADIKSAISGLVGIDTLDVGTVAQARWNVPRIEIALVLDNTGSMRSNKKMDELKKAVGNMLTTMETVRQTADQVRIAIVPFDTQINIGTSYRKADWIRFDTSDLSKALRTTQAGWTGCLTDRDQPGDTNDAAPISDATRYRAAACTTGSLAQMAPLTDDFGPLRTVVGDMQPSGNTNITIGLQMGLAVLSTAPPFSEASTDPDVMRFLVLLTDGENTENRFSTSSSSIDGRTRAACKTVRDAGITLFTVRVIDGNASLLSGCATPPTPTNQYYYSVNDAVGIGEAFKAITDVISRIRLSA